MRKYHQVKLFAYWSDTPASIRDKKFYHSSDFRDPRCGDVVRVAGGWGINSYDSPEAWQAL